jgi:hypothetical protein
MTEADGSLTIRWVSAGQFDRLQEAFHAMRGRCLGDCRHLRFDTANADAGAWWLS